MFDQSGTASDFTSKTLKIETKSARIGLTTSVEAAIMKVRTGFLAISVAAMLSVSGQVTAQEFPDPATQLKQRLAAFAAPFVQEENPDATLSEWAATIVCIVEALTPLPDGVRFEMLLTEDFEDALDLAVGYVERTGLVADLERNLEACF